MMSGISHNRIDDANESLWQSRFSGSQLMSEKALALIKKAEKENYEKGIACAKLNYAASNFYQSKNEIALQYLTEALAWFENNKSQQGYIRALLLKGNIFESFGDYEKTLRFWLEAFNASVKAGDRESEGEACSQLGLIYSRLCNFQKALEFFKKGLQIREELGDENAVASSLNRMGMLMRQTKKYQESLEYYFRSLDIRKRNNQLSAIPWTLLGIGNTYEEMNKFQESLEYYEEGLKGGDQRCQQQCLMGSGRVYSNMQEAGKAEKRLKESLHMAKELKSQVLIAESYASLAKHYEHSGKHIKALESFKLHLKAKEAYHSTEVQSKLSNIEVAHAVERSEQEKEIYRLKHVELKQAYDIIEEKNRDITASINYASRIQHAILNDPGDMEELSKNSFVLFLPKDIVSGDFYWFSRLNNKEVVVAGDCTGHGVPGALMSMLGISFLEEIINTRKITESGKILNELRKEVQRALHQKGNREEAKDGMDIALCIIDRSKNIIQYSGAYNNLYLIRNGELKEYHADRMPIGIFDYSDKEFASTNIPCMAGDIIYMFSDGYADQFGGPDNKKFKYSTFKNLLLSIYDLPLRKQKKQLESEFLKWKGDNAQTDDVVVLGYKI